MTKWTVYCHIHTESGRRYVGLTKLTMMKRWNRHVYDAIRRSRGITYFHNAIRKHGKDAFDHEVLETCQTLEEANAAEEKWIAHFDTRDPEKGFNLKKGGDHRPHPVNNPWDRPEYRDKMLLINKRLWDDPVFRHKLRQAQDRLKDDPAFMAKIRDPGLSLRHSASSRAAWQDPGFRQRILDGKRRPRSVAALLAPAAAGRPDPIPGKKCCRCGDPGLFGKDASKKDGLKSVCKVCEKKSRSARTDRIRAHSKARRKKIRKAMRHYQKAWYAANRGRVALRDAARSEAIRAVRVARKERLREIVLLAKSSPCSGCGGHFCPDDLDFYRPGTGHKSVRWMVNHLVSESGLLRELRERSILCLQCFRKASSGVLVIRRRAA